MAREDLAAPELIDLEVLQALRRLVRSDAMNEVRAASALFELTLTPVARLPHLPLADRVWELRDNLSAYDAAYVALAETLGAPLLTSDRRLASAPGLRCEVELIS